MKDLDDCTINAKGSTSMDLDVPYYMRCVEPGPKFYMTQNSFDDDNKVSIWEKKCSGIVEATNATLSSDCTLTPSLVSVMALKTTL